MLNETYMPLEARREAIFPIRIFRRLRERVRVRAFFKKETLVESEVAQVMEDAKAELLVEATMQVDKQRNPENPEQLFEMLKNPHYIPSHGELVSLFGNSTNTGQEDKWKDLYRNEKDEVKTFEIWTQEYITELTNHLEQSIGALKGRAEKPVRIVEVGAGDGKLSFFLKKELQSRIGDAFTLEATDTGERGIAQDFPVSNSAFEEVMINPPDIIISSWTPSGADWKTTCMKAGVSEFIAIGEEGSTGLANEGDNSNYWKETKVSSSDGSEIDYSLTYLEEARKYQLSGISLSEFQYRLQNGSLSSTRSYRKK